MGGEGFNLVLVNYNNITLRIHCATPPSRIVHPNKASVNTDWLVTPRWPPVARKNVFFGWLETGYWHLLHGITHKDCAAPKTSSWSLSLLADFGRGRWFGWFMSQFSQSHHLFMSSLQTMQTMGNHSQTGWRTLILKTAGFTGGFKLVSGPLSYLNLNMVNLWL